MKRFLKVSLVLFVSALLMTTLLSLSGLAEEYDIWVGCVQVTTDNASDVLGDGTVSYDIQDSVLTLDNATITDSYTYFYNVSTDEETGEETIYDTRSAAIYSTIPVVINLVGDNVIEVSDCTTEENAGILYGRDVSTTETVVRITGDSSASLSIKSGGTEKSRGVFASAGDLIVENIILSIETADVSAYSVALMIEDADNFMTIDSANVTLVAGDADTDDLSSGSYEALSAGLAGGTITIKGGSVVTATAGDVSSTSTSSSSQIVSCGVFMIGRLYVIDGSTLTATAGDAYGAGGAVQSVGTYVLGEIIVEGYSTLSSYGGEAITTGEVSDELDCYSGGVCNCLVGVTVGEGSTINASSSNATGVSVGVYIDDVTSDPEYDETITLDDSGTINITSENNVEGGLCVAIVTDNEIVNGTVRDALTGEILTYSNSSYVLGDSEEYAAAVSINGGIVYFGDYNLAVGDIVVTEENKDDIFGDLDGDGATAYYNPETNTLYLDNASVTTVFDMEGAYAGILCMNSLNIDLVGNNKLIAPVIDELSSMAMGVAVVGELVISSDKYATLEAYAAESTSETYGICTLTMDGEYTSNLVVKGNANVIGYAGDIDFTSPYVTSGGVYIYGNVDVTDAASLIGYGGSVTKSEGYTDSTTDYQAMSVGIVSLGMFTANTSGKIYGYAETAPTLFGGMGFVGGLTLTKGLVVGEAGQEAPEGAAAIGLCVLSNVENSKAFTGPSGEELYDGSWSFLSSSYGGAYVYGENGDMGTYTMLVSEKYFGNLDVEDAAGAQAGEEKIVSVTISGYDNVIVAFASYDESGRMIDMAYKASSDADEYGSLECDTLDVAGAVRVKSFMFENTVTFVPLEAALEKYV